MYGTYDMKRKILKIESVEYACFENLKVIIFYDGIPSPQFYTLIEKNSFDVDWMSAFIGPFQLIAFKKKSGELLITQHFFGNGKNLYFCISDNVMYLSSTLNELRKIVKKPFKLNISMLPHYFYNGFLANSHTLIAGVYKLEAESYYIIKGRNIHKNKLIFEKESSIESSEDITNQLESEYMDALDNIITSLGNEIENSVAIALSGGFDSNCILYSLHKRFPEKKVYAFSVGGLKGINETETAFEIANQYKNVSFKKSLVTPETLKHLDEIVAILEGSVYERGIFLQYELAKLLNKHNVDCVFCGECADQVFHSNTYKSIADDTFLYGYVETPLQMAVYAVLKKSRMMMNAFGVHAFYPFLALDMIRVGFKSQDINGTTKEFHKMQCKKMLPESILELMEKKGGSTDLSALFPENFDINHEIKKCKYYSKDFMISKKYDQEESLRDYYLSLLFLESFEKQFCF